MKCLCSLARPVPLPAALELACDDAKLFAMPPQVAFKALRFPILITFLTASLQSDPKGKSVALLFCGGLTVLKERTKGPCWFETEHSSRVRHINTLASSSL